MASGVSWGGSVAGVGCTRVPARTPGRRGRPPRWSLPVGTGVGVHRGVANSALLSWMPHTTHSAGESGGGYKPLPRTAARALRCRPRANPNQRALLRSCSRSVLSPLRDPMDRSTPGRCAPHQLPEFAQAHARHRVGDAIQPSHRLLPSSPLPSIIPSQGH